MTTADWVSRIIDGLDVFLPDLLFGHISISNTCSRSRNLEVVVMSRLLFSAVRLGSLDFSVVVASAARCAVFYMTKEEEEEEDHKTHDQQNLLARR